MKINSEILYELVNDGVIKPGTKLKAYKDDIYVTNIVFDGYDFIWASGTFSSGMLFNPLVDFEIIEEELSPYVSNADLLKEITMNRNKINEILREIRKLKEK